MTSFKIPEHSEQSLCECVYDCVYASYMHCGKTCKYRFINLNEGMVKYTCGGKKHMNAIGETQTTSFVIQKRTQNPLKLWKNVTVLSYTNQYLHKDVKEDVPKKKRENVPHNSNDDSEANDRLIANQARIIKQLEADIDDKEKIISNIICNKKANYTHRMDKLFSDAKRALTNAKQLDNVCLLKLQLDPNKNPKELGWLFTELSNIIEKQ